METHIMNMLSKVNRNAGRRQDKLKANTHRKQRRGTRCSCRLLPCWSLCLGLWLLCLAWPAATSPTKTTAATTTTTSAKVISTGDTPYSQPLTTMAGVAHRDDNTFQPMLPKDISPEFISRNVFTKAGQYRVFQPVESESDLRLAVAIQRKNYNSNNEEPTITTTTKTTVNQANKVQAKSTVNAATTTTATATAMVTQALPTSTTASRRVEQTTGAAAAGTPYHGKTEVQGTEESTSTLDKELKGLEQLLMDYVDRFFGQGQFEPTKELVQALQQNQTAPSTKPATVKRHVRHAKREASGKDKVETSRAVASGRLLFFTGLKKIMWPIYMGLQVLKSLLFALFLPTIIGSVSRLIGKGITSGSASSVPLFIRPMDPPQELDFRDNSVNFDDDKFSLADDSTKNTAGYEYNAEASQQQAQYASFNGNAISPQTLSRYGGQQQLMQDTYLSALQSIGAASFKNSQSLSSGSSAAGLAAPGMAKKPPSPANMNTFQSFQKVPSSSLLLSNYDPFYSPLLSRLDSVFAQLKLNSENENCREKLICLMYANPAKYAPYSNLVSAQLSRELNELRKPTSDNPDILRFFKYMRAAKDGQDGVDCEQSFVKCKEFKDFENPAMLSTFNDINKLVQARKLA